MIRDRTWERRNIAKDKKLGVISDSDTYWAKKYRGVGKSLVRSVRNNEGIAPAPTYQHSLEAKQARENILADPDLEKESLVELAKKHNTTKYNVLKAFEIAGIDRSRPVTYEPPWHARLSESWKRARGIQKHLEAIHELT